MMTTQGFLGFGIVLAEAKAPIFDPSRQQTCSMHRRFDRQYRHHAGKFNDGDSMSLKNHFALMARYNQWMNTKIYDASSRLGEPGLHADKGAFFKSVFGTLNHLMSGDRIWLKRFADHPAAFRALEPVRPLPHPYSLAQPLFGDFESLRTARSTTDAVILALAAEATEADYAQHLTYANSTGQVFVDAFGPLMQHFFNHQTHHRGQVSTLLSQAGIDVGVTDLVALMRQRAA